MRPLVTGTVAICFNIFVRKEKDHMIGTLTHWGQLSRMARTRRDQFAYQI